MGQLVELVDTIPFTMATTSTSSYLYVRELAMALTRPELGAYDNNIYIDNLTSLLSAVSIVSTCHGGLPSAVILAHENRRNSGRSLYKIKNPFFEWVDESRTCVEAGLEETHNPTAQTYDSTAAVWPGFTQEDIRQGDCLRCDSSTTSSVCACPGVANIMAVDGTKFTESMSSACPDDGSLNTLRNSLHDIEATKALGRTQL